MSLAYAKIMCFSLKNVYSRVEDFFFFKQVQENQKRNTSEKKQSIQTGQLYINPNTTPEQKQPGIYQARPNRKIKKRKMKFVKGEENERMQGKTKGED